MNIEIDIEWLKKICLSPKEYFYQFGEVYNNKYRPYIYQRNKSKILAVAHIDTYGDLDQSINTNNFVVHDFIVHSPQLDDRLGVYMLLKLLPTLGIKTDVLLTDQEEEGKSTAELFVKKQNYNWICEFDRAGTGVVMYQYDDYKTRELIEQYDFEVEKGSNSDISYLESLGIKAFNFGIGYHHQHTNECYANLNETKFTIERFIKFYNENKKNKLVHNVNHMNFWGEDI